VSVTTAELACPGGMPAFLARPSGKPAGAGVILLHERYGLVRHTRDLAEKCAADGFVVLAPNLFFRHPDAAALNAGASRYDLTDPEAVDLLHGAVQTLETQAGLAPERIAIAGYCQTGRHPLVYGAEHPVGALVIWYGAAAKREWGVTERQPQPLADVIARLRAPIFGAFGADDHIISRDDVRRFRGALEDNGLSYDMHLYEGAPHGWLNDTMPGRYRKAQAEAGWAAQQAFLKSVFAGEWPASRVRWRFAADTPADYDFARNVRRE
jgi:carboxymethylenebutenolidase